MVFRKITDKKYVRKQFENKKKLKQPTLATARIKSRNFLPCRLVVASSQSMQQASLNHRAYS